MPAHCGSNFQGKRLSNGEALSQADVDGNAYVDSLAKQAAQRDRAPREQVAIVRNASSRLESIALWIGQATAFANHFPDPRSRPQNGKSKYLRDSDAVRRPSRRLSRTQRCADPVSQAIALGRQPLPQPGRLEEATPPLRASGSSSKRQAGVHKRLPASKRLRKAAACTAAQDERAQAAQVAAWLSGRELTARAGPPAPERMEALRQRILQRASQRGSDN